MRQKGCSSTSKARESWKMAALNTKGNYMKLTSQAFTNGGKIPDKYSMYGENKVPPLHIDEVPEKARSLALIVDDPDAPNGTFNHWLLFNIDPKVRDIKENSVPVMATQGRNDFGEVEYDGPKPPSGEHRYYFRAFALDAVLPVSRGVRRDELDREMEHHVLETATLMGKFSHAGGMAGGGSINQDDLKAKRETPMRGTRNSEKG